MREIYNNGDWTPGRMKGFVTSALRSAWQRWPPRYLTLKNAIVGRLINKKTGKLAIHLKCSKCKQSFIAKDVQVDHIKPVVDPKKGFVDWETYIDRLFCEATNLQVLCKKCHNLKTAAEKVLRIQK